MPIINKTIMKHLFITILFFAALSVQATAQETLTFPKGKKATNTEDFTGTIWLNNDLAQSCEWSG